jgi:hypothetical protein
MSRLSGLTTGYIAATVLQAAESACRPGSVTPLSVTWRDSPETLADLRFNLSWLLISSCVFSRSGGTETELADLGPLAAPGELPAEREQWDSQGQGSFLVVSLGCLSP